MVGKIGDQINPDDPVVYFIYNANSGKLNAYLDMMHKVLSPKTYPCQLCDITYGVRKIHPEWKAFREKSKLRMVFLHKDEWEKAFPDMKIGLPAVLLGKKNGFKVVLGPNDWKEITLDGLKKLIDEIEHTFIYHRKG